MIMDEKAKRKLKNKIKNISSLDIYVTFSILSLIVYTIISQIIAVRMGMILDTLTTCFFGFFGGEIVTCGLIKIFKLQEIRKGNINDNSNINDNGGMAVG